ncbi:MAG: hypothetical protein ACOC8E_05840 [Planctomycetota bacterium]
MTRPVSKAAADAHCVVFDSGKQVAYPIRLAVDAENRPYIKNRTGVRDRARGKTIVPMRSKYATRREGRWRVTDKIPGEWPAGVKTILGGRGLPATAPAARRSLESAIRPRLAPCPQCIRLLCSAPVVSAKPVSGLVPDAPPGVPAAHRRAKLGFLWTGWRQTLDSRRISV